MEKELLLQIEELRRRLNKFAFGRSLVDPEIVELSQRLDHLLNEYYRLGDVA